MYVENGQYHKFIKNLIRNNKILLSDCRYKKDISNTKKLTINNSIEESMKEWKSFLIKKYEKQTIKFVKLINPNATKLRAVVN